MLRGLHRLPRGSVAVRAGGRAGRDSGGTRTWLNPCFLLNEGAVPGDAHDGTAGQQPRGLARALPAGSPGENCFW